MLHGTKTRKEILKELTKVLKGADEISVTITPTGFLFRWMVGVKIGETTVWNYCHGTVDRPIAWNCWRLQTCDDYKIPECDALDITYKRREYGNGLSLSEILAIYNVTYWGVTSRQNDTLTERTEQTFLHTENATHNSVLRISGDSSKVYEHGVARASLGERIPSHSSSIFCFTETEKN